MNDDHNPLENSSAQDSQQRKRIFTTICPPGCGSGKCCRVFEDTLGLGYEVLCVCICHENEEAAAVAIGDNATGASSHTVMGLSEDELP